MEFLVDRIEGLRSSPIAADEIAEVRLERMPPEIVLRTGEVCFISATQRPWLELFCRHNGIENRHRIDVWSELTEPFLDTEMPDDVAAKTLERLASCGLDEKQVETIRAGIREPMLAYTAVTWEWCHYGHADVLAALKSALSASEFATFKAASMRLAALGVETPPWDPPLDELMGFAWRDLTQRLGVPIGTGSDSCAQVIESYQDSARHYHNLRHVRQVLERAQALAATCEDRPAVEAAAWFHDIVYDPLSSTNEADSADVMRAVLSPLGVEVPVVDRIDSLIRTTGNPSGAVDPSEQALVDADFSILGETPAVYDAYAAGVRREYGAYSDADYRAGRAVFLDSVIATRESRGRLFFSLPPICETLGAANITREREGL